MRILWGFMGKLRKLPSLDPASVERLTSLIFGGGVSPEVRQLMADQIKDKTVLVTGAGGSIGGSLCRRLAQLSPDEVVMVDQSENGLYETHRSVEWDGRFVTLMGDVRHSAKMEAVFEDYQPDLVIHAAALKQVPMLENPHNLIEAVRTNVLGTNEIAHWSDQVGAKFVLVSTDKAVNPSSILGLTKRVAELVIATLWNGSNHSIVRFGNVMNSCGSAIPLFREQIERGGPVTVTDRRMTRYMMTLGQAVDLVLASFALPPQLHVLDMGNPIRILDLAHMLIRMADKEPLEDVGITEIGIRPGEKLDEELFYPDEAAKSTSQLAGIMSAPLPRQKQVENDLFRLVLGGFELDDPQTVQRELARIVPDYRGTWQL
jgi:FlaA1/EpsC-like NDP-sugar epimerase